MSTTRSSLCSTGSSTLEHKSTPSSASSTHKAHHKSELRKTGATQVDVDELWEVKQQLDKKEVENARLVQRLEDQQNEKNRAQERAQSLQSENASIRDLFTHAVDNEATKKTAFLQGQIRELVSRAGDQQRTRDKMVIENLELKADNKDLAIEVANLQGKVKQLEAKLSVHEESSIGPRKFDRNYQPDVEADRVRTMGSLTVENLELCERIADLAVENQNLRRAAQR